MDRINKWPYHLPTTLKGQAARIRFNWNSLFWLVASFFMGRAALMGEVAPFPLIFWALVMRSCPQRKNLVTVLLILGWATTDAGVFPPWFMPAAMLTWVTLDFLLTKIFHKKITLSLTLPLSIILLRLPLLYQQHFMVYETSIVILEVILAALLPSLLHPFFHELQEKQEGKPSPEAIAGGVLLLFLVFLGMHGLAIGNQVTLVNIVCPLIILVGAHLWGPLWGVVGGLAVGLGLSFGHPAMFHYTGALGIAGLIAGLLQPYRRLWTALGFLLVLRFLACYLAEGGYLLTTAGEELLITGVFLLVPPTAWQKLKELNIFWPFKQESEQNLRFTMATRVKEFASVFKELAVTFQPQGAAEEMRTKKDLSPLVDYFSRKVCRSCQHFNRCWKKDLFDQYRRVLNMFSTVEEKGNFSERQIPIKLRRFCPRQQDIVRAILNMREIYRLNCYWQDKIYKSRSLVSEQLAGLATIMHDLAQELKLQPEENSKPTGHELTPVRYSLEIGVAQVARNGQDISGDSYAVVPLKDGKQALILSDGMGSGQGARFASASTVKLMEHLLGIGFRREVAINTLNTLLCLGYPSEKFATLDLALLDLQAGEIELYKLGAAPSFLKNGKTVRTIGSVSLPVGILEDIVPEKNCLKISGGGTLVMVTDGVLDTGPEIEKEWLTRTLEEIRHDHPQIIADRLIEEACGQWPRGVRDDLTVLVGRLRPPLVKETATAANNPRKFSSPFSQTS
ncbi:MAG: SpoIIE family protein phosphatase [Dethiobacteria bacterium]